MDEAKRKTRRHLLRSLKPRSQRAFDQKHYVEAMRRLDDRAIGQSTVPELREALTARPRERSTDWKDPARSRALIELTKALYASRRISKQEYVFYALSPAEHVHDGRWMDGQYAQELKAANESIRRFEREHGLKADEYWERNDAPREYLKLNRQYEAILDAKFRDTLREFGLDDLLAILERSREELDRLRERGRRSVFHHDEYIPALQDVISEYESEAQKAAAAGAYLAAVTSLGAGVEGLLLLRCLRSRRKAVRIAKKLPKRMRPRSFEDLGTWTFETLIEVCLAAEWLQPVETSVAVYNPAGMAHMLRLMRNLVHPGRHARERPWSVMDEQEYLDADAFYRVMMSKLEKVHRKPT